MFFKTLAESLFRNKLLMLNEKFKQSTSSQNLPFFLLEYNTKIMICVLK